MKELVYRNISGNNPRKREVSIEETSSRTQTRIAKKWLCKYFIKERYTGSDKEDIKRWIESRKEGNAVRNCHVLRNVNTDTGQNTMICKILSDLYIVKEMTAYRIIYVNEVRIHIEESKRGMYEF